MDVLFRAVAALPDSAVRLLPDRTDVGDHVPERLPGCGVDHLALLVVKQGSEDARRRHMRETAPIHRAGRAHQDTGVEVTDDPVVTIVE